MKANQIMMKDRKIMIRPKLLALFLGIYFSTIVSTYAQTPAFKTRIVASELSIPWELVWGPDNQLWMTELRGGISKIDPTTGSKTVLLEALPDLAAGGEGGLLGMVLHPQFIELPFVYIAYTYSGGPSVRVKIVRYRYDASTLVEPTIIVDGIPGGGIHNGCRLAFGPDDMLYITTGETGSGALAQNVAGLNGKVLRVTRDGEIPDDNPRAGSRVWSWGHRNAQGMAFGPDGTLYISEHGPNTDDEINIVLKGRNYGWPTVRGFCDKTDEQVFCTDSNVVEPIGATWTPTIAPSQLVYYTSTLIPEWTNHLIMCTLKNKTLRVLTLSEDRSRYTEDDEYFKDVFGRLRAICVSPDGRVFVSTSNKDIYGKLADYPGSDMIIEISPQASGVDDDTQSSTFTLSGTQLTARSEATSAATMPGTPATTATLIITDLLGRTMHREVGGSEGVFHIDLSNFPVGLYSAVLHSPRVTEAFTFMR